MFCAAGRALSGGRVHLGSTRTPPIDCASLQPSPVETPALKSRRHSARHECRCANTAAGLEPQATPAHITGPPTASASSSAAPSSAYCSKVNLSKVKVEEADSLECNDSLRNVASSVGAHMLILFGASLAAWQRGRQADSAGVVLYGVQPTAAEKLCRGIPLAPRIKTSQLGGREAAQRVHCRRETSGFSGSGAASHIVSRTGGGALLEREQGTRAGRRTISSEQYAPAKRSTDGWLASPVLRVRTRSSTPLTARMLVVAAAAMLWVWPPARH